VRNRAASRRGHQRDVRSRAALAQMPARYLQPLQTASDRLRSSVAHIRPLARESVRSAQHFVHLPCAARP
jgi:hypothetical protein